MNESTDKVGVTIEEVKDSATGSVGGDPGVVIATESVVDGELRDTSIEVRDADAPAIAMALLNADVEQPHTSHDLPPAVQCLAAGVMHAAGAGQVRIHLQFESGQVLPVEVSRDAATALSRALGEHTGTH